MELSASQSSTGHKVENDVNNEQGPYHEATIVLFSLDTTDLKTKHKEICQIAAFCNGKTFQVYILPEKHDIAPDASLEHGIKLIQNADLSYKMVHNNIVVKSFSPKEGLLKFLSFLSDLTAGKTRKVLLAAHGCSSFQRHMLVNQLKECDMMDEFQSLVLGTIDTIQVFKSELKKPDQKTKEQKGEYELESLAVKYLEENFIEGQQDANRKVKILESLIKVIGCTDAKLKQHVKDLDVFMRTLDLKNYLKDAVTPNMIGKIASAGITIDELKDEYKANGDGGVSKILQEKVTKTSKSIQKILVAIKNSCTENKLTLQGNIFSEKSNKI